MALATTYTSTGLSSFTMPAEEVILYAQWTANNNTTYKVNHYLQNVEGSGYTLNGGAGVTHTGTTDTTVTPTASSFTGFTATTPISSITITGNGLAESSIYYTRNTHSVSYDKGFTGSSISLPATQSSVRYGANVTPNFSGIGTRTGYTFAGWKNGSNTWTSGGGQSPLVMPDSDVTFIAQWNAVEYDIVFNENGGTFAGTYTKPQKYTIESSTITLPTSSNITKTGYTFGGWYTTSGLTGTAQTTIDSGSTGIKTYYAKWNPVTYTLNLQENDNATYAASWTGTEPVEFNTNQLPYNLPTASSSNKVTRTGYTFDGWYTAASGGTKVTQITAIGNQTYYAHWNPVTYTLNLLENDNETYTASWTGTEPVEFNTNQLPYNLPTASSSNKVTRTGYTFDGWYTAASGGTKVTQITSIGAKTYYARWSPVTYTLNLIENDSESWPASWTGTEPVEFNTNQLPYNLPTASSSNKVTRTGYTFDGWYTAASGGTKVTQIPTSGTSNQTYYAHWSPETYTLNLIENDSESWPASWTGTEPTSFTTANLPYTLPTQYTSKKVTRPGYVFRGWYTASTGGTQVTQITEIGNQTYYAQWNLAGYHVDLIENDSEEYPAIWVGTEPDSFNVTHLPYTLPTATSTNRLTRDYYSFDGWYTAATDGTKITQIPTTGLSDQTYYAHWTPVSYTITLNVNGGSWLAGYSAPASYTVESPAVTLPPSSKISKTNSIFTGWYTASTGGTKVTEIAAGSHENKTYYAQWVSANVSVTSPSAAITAISNAVDGQTITLSGAVTSEELQQIGTAIKDSSAKVKLDISGISGITTIPNSCFSGCSNLTGITLPSCITSIGGSCFHGCSIESITIPSNITSIGSKAFNANFKLTSVTLEEGVTSIGSQAFAFNTALQSIEIPASVTTIYKDAFVQSSKLESINVNSSNTHFKDIDGVLCNKAGTTLLFYPSAKAGSYTIPASVTEIGSYAFYGCNSTLTNLIIPDNVLKISISAFQYYYASNVTCSGHAWYKTTSLSEYNSLSGATNLVEFTTASEFAEMLKTDSSSYYFYRPDS